MRGPKRITLVFLLTLLFITSAAFAQKDVEGSKDHPLVGRFAGAVIAVYDPKDFDEYLLPLGKLMVKDSRYQWTKSQKLEGKVTRITYVAPKNASTLAILRSYETALKKAGFAVLFTGGDQELAGLSYMLWYEEANPHPGNRRYMLGNSSQRYLTAKLPRSQGDIYVSVYTAISNNIYSGYPTIQVDVIEVKALEAGLVTAQAMGEEIEKAGRVAIYSIYFDTGKAELKPESEPTLKEIAALLQRNSRLSLYVVGHTDNVGTLGYNMDLSQRRAEAVVKAVVAKHKIEVKRLHSAGVGPLAPIAPNTTDEGRAKNRRVELVAQ